MREANFNFPAYNRACICISSGLYDRRALDAPTASLPLVNSLHHLANLTATSPRIREILVGDGGLERLVRILKFCAQGGRPIIGQVQDGEEPLPTLAEWKGKGKEGLALERRSRQNPFKSFAEYDLLPTLEDLQDLESADVDGRLLALSGGTRQTGYAYSIPHSLLLPSPQEKARHLLYTYALAFQCIVNIGVRGSEAIRTRVVEAGALDVVVYVLERYLEDTERRRVASQLEWRREEQERRALREFEERRDAQQRREGEMQVEVEAAAMQEDPTLLGSSSSIAPTQLNTADVFLSSASVSPMSSVPVSPLPPSAPSLSQPSAASVVAALATPTVASRPLLTRLNVVAASSAAASSSASSASSLGGSGSSLTPPSRVQTPDTVVSMDETASLTGDDNGSTSGADEEMTTIVGSSASLTAPVPPSRVRSVVKSEDVAMDVDVDGQTDRPAVRGEQSDSRDSSDREDGEEADGEVVPIPLRQYQEDARRRSRSSHSHSHSLSQGQAQATPRHSASTMHSSAAAAPPPAPAAYHVPPPPPSHYQQPQQPSFTFDPTIAGADGQHPLYFRDEDVVLSLQLLAYLSKYAHVRKVFHESAPAVSGASYAAAQRYHPSAGHHGSSSSSSRRPILPPTNVFSLVESFTYRPPVPPSQASSTAPAPASKSASTSGPSTDPTSASPSGTASAPTSAPAPTHPHPTEIQYWAGVIMRNACRKDDRHGGIRQCANMRCGRWEEYAREFAKCRRCRRAKYCSKTCQSEAWNQGHRWWCHKVAARRREGRDGAAPTGASSSAANSSTSAPHLVPQHTGGDSSNPASGTEGLATPTNEQIVGEERRRRHGHGQHHHHQSRRRPATSAAEDDDEDEDDFAPPHRHHHHHPDAAATPRAAQHPLGLAPLRDRDLTLRPATLGMDGTATPPAPTAITGAGGDGPTPPVTVAVAGEEGDAMGLAFAAAAAAAAAGWDGLGVGVDEDQVAREMMAGAGGGGGGGGRVPTA
ncbi:hypothetical protein JCM11251_001452 [Rhodosporidiobolus azoricus]